MTGDQPAKTVIVSPHFDDAVFSCWTVIDSDDPVDVITIFTAGPRPGVVADWDRDTGVDSATRMKQRVAENDAALAVAGRRATNLGFLEAMYDGGGIDINVLREHLLEARSVYIPAGVGLVHRNAEHAVVRDACLSVRPDSRLYADQPYCHFRSDIDLPEGFGFGLRRVEVSLSVAERERKAQAIRCYLGELVKLERLFGPCTDANRLGGEAFWVPDRENSSK
jgi:hypothetical protein